ncbi:MAG: DUF4192 family protein [Corynebacterium sp.]|uniref:DUF4192 family protein n=1 Tax=Corynebacterium TaxID=1716 RepID=UPI00290A5553|nr:DUF4192 family protein [Corynebacterium sp.]MDU4729779.1 DUF4192 family protein [Corynebacterium sp.]
MATELTKSYEHYLDRIARGQVSTTKFNQPALKQLADYVAHVECRDLFFDRTPNKLEGQAWETIASRAGSAHVRANAWCLAAFHTTEHKTIPHYLAMAQRAVPDHSLANMMIRLYEIATPPGFAHARARGGRSARELFEGRGFVLGLPTVTS